jgi:CsoR family transcriptional regulator, copper-sensing transcriptional repressor
MADHANDHGYIANKDDYLRRLRRIEGQARGLQKMVEEEQYCIDILTQVSAMTRALQSVALGLLEEHLSHCVVRAAAEGGPEADGKIEEPSKRKPPICLSPPSTSSLGCTANTAYVQ